LYLSCVNDPGDGVIGMGRVADGHEMAAREMRLIDERGLRSSEGAGKEFMA
jgi:hypothetical protein